MIYIPAGIGVKINENINFEKHGLYAPAVQLFISGRLSFKSGNSLNLSENSSVIIGKKGIICSKKNENKRSSFISIHMLKVWSNKEGDIAGSLILGQKLSLPHELIAFKIEKSRDTFVISWQLKQFEEAGYYELFVSKNGRNWQSIKKMKAIHNDSIEKIICHVYGASKKDVNLFFRLDACDLIGNTRLMAVTKSEIKMDYIKILLAIPKILIASSLLKFVDGFIHSSKTE